VGHSSFHILMYFEICDRQWGFASSRDPLLSAALNFVSPIRSTSRVAVVATVMSTVSL
jgi:hypothetical protein